MSNHLPKNRLTYFCKNGNAYQTFTNPITGPKVLVYIKIDSGYVCSAEFPVDEPITTADALGDLAERYEAAHAKL